MSNRTPAKICHRKGNLVKFAKDVTVFKKELFVMRSLDEIRARTPKIEIFRGQIQHAMLATLLVAGALSLLRDDGAGLLGVSALGWAKLTIAITVIHQVVVAIVFRLQLHLNIMVRLFGDRALKVWGAVFMPMLAARPLLVLTTGLASLNTLEGDRSFQLVLGAILLIAPIWGMHSVVKHFTFSRALGGDHFFDRFANMPLVDKGIFKFFQNGMYSFVFLGFWAIALLTGSWNALILALFQHAYIWVHMYCTEDPDMKIIYEQA